MRLDLIIGGSRVELKLVLLNLEEEEEEGEGILSVDRERREATEGWKFRDGVCMMKMVGLNLRERMRSYNQDNVQYSLLVGQVTLNFWLGDSGPP